MKKGNNVANVPFFVSFKVIARTGIQRLLRNLNCQ